MFRRSAAGKNFIAFLLPLAFIWSWAACSLLCSEIAEAGGNQAVLSIEQRGEKCLVGANTESCPFTANITVLETRPIVISPAAIAKTVSPARHEYLFVPAAVYPADLNQNSPPRAASDLPLFLKNRAFRI